MSKSRIAAVTLFCLLAGGASAQQVPWRAGSGPGASSAATPSLRAWTGARYDAAIPTLQSVIGHDHGERVTRPEDVIGYFEALAAAAPDRIKVFEYARSWENRPLIYAAIGSAENIARLDALKSGMQQLADPRVVRAGDADRLLTELPATAWIAYGVHGNEISSTDAAILTAYHLLAAEGDPTVDKILANTVVFLDPMQNPDGRARFTHNFEIAEGLEASASRIAAERNEPWPGGRTNHYLFDMNRDWFALTQPETRGRIKALRQWLPLVFVDAHEMGSDSTYYFAPEALPYNPHLAAGQRASLELFGRNNARAFDRNGFLYFTREVYDAFYPGYGASWPSYYGAVAMTYEQASARGLKARRTDGTEFHYRDTVRQHFTTSIATAETVADNREKLLRDFLDYRRSAIEEGRRDTVRSYVLAPGAASDKIASLLVAQGVEVRTASGAFSACGRNYAAEAHVVPLAQPSKRLIRTLLDQQVDMEPGFLEEQERRRARDLPDEIYDVTAWSLPLMFGADMRGCDVAIGGGEEFRAHDGRAFAPGRVAGPEDAVFYLVPWGAQPAVRLLSRLHRNAVPVLSSDKAFTAGGRRYPGGTLIIPAKEGPADLRSMLARFAAETGAEVVALADSWVTEGPNFGSENVVRMPAPKIAIAWDAPTASNQAGATRFVVERQFDYPVTAVRVDDLADRSLDAFDVLILPGGGDYAGVLGKGGVARLKTWVEAGGTLVASSTALRFLSNPDTGLLSVKRETAAREDEPAKPAEGATAPGVLITDADAARAAIQPASEAPDPSSGVLARASVDDAHWLGAGVAPIVNVLVSGGDIYQPATLDNGYNVARFAGPDDLLASGFIWEETRRQYAYKPFAISEEHGDGEVIAFTQDPTFRAYMDGLNMLYANAIFRGPAHASPVR